MDPSAPTCQVIVLNWAFYKLLDQFTPTWQIVEWWAQFTQILTIILILCFLQHLLCNIYTIKVETIENNSHPKWTTLTHHRCPHTAGPKMVDRWKQLFLKCFHSKPPTFLRIALLCTHCTHLLISYGKPIRGRMQIRRPHVHGRMLFRRWPCAGLRTRPVSFFLFILFIRQQTN